MSKVFADSSANIGVFEGAGILLLSEDVDMYHGQFAGCVRFEFEFA